MELEVRPEAGDFRPEAGDILRERPDLVLYVALVVVHRIPSLGHRLRPPLRRLHRSVSGRPYNVHLPPDKGRAWVDMTTYGDPPELIAGNETVGRLLLAEVSLIHPSIFCRRLPSTTLS